MLIQESGGKEADTVRVTYIQMSKLLWSATEAQAESSRDGVVIEGDGDGGSPGLSLELWDGLRAQKHTHTHIKHTSICALFLPFERFVPRVRREYLLPRLVYVSCTGLVNTTVVRPGARCMLMLTLMPVHSYSTYSSSYRCIFTSCLPLSSASPHPLPPRYRLPPRAVFSYVFLLSSPSPSSSPSAVYIKEKWSQINLNPKKVIDGCTKLPLSISFLSTLSLFPHSLPPPTPRSHWCCGSFSFTHSLYSLINYLGLQGTATLM